jgi:methionyl-tRNA synthetase
MTRYITTPIYYVNDRPHIGHCYTTLVADADARFERLIAGDPAKVFMLTGTDEHADKVVTTAATHGLSPIEWADRNAEEFRKAFAFIRSSHDDFIRTTQDRHKSRVVEYVRALLDSGAIYKGTYEGWYDENQEEYLTETVAKDAGYKSPVTGRPLVRRQENCYFFRLSAYQQRLEAHFAQHPGFVRPDARRNEVLGRLRDGLNDVPVSRPVTSDPATQFGIRVPGDEDHRIYVWIDALFNYLSVVDTDERRGFWPASIHFIAKDILWFHAVIWPAMLMALQDTASRGTRFAFVSLPGGVYSHAYWVREGRKMSKSLNNFVTIEVLEAYAAAFSLDALRWYLLTQGPLHAQDADFSHAKFVEVYNSDLANGIGNCASRVANMIEKYFQGTVPEPRQERPGEFLKNRGDTSLDVAVRVRKAHGTPFPEGAENRSFDFPREVERRLKDCTKALADADTGEALRQGTMLVRYVDDFISHTAPFTLAKHAVGDDVRDALAAILYACAEAVRIASVLLSPAMPGKMEQLWKAWGCTPAPGATLQDLCAFAGPHALKPGRPLGKGEALFMRADPAAAPPA